MKIGDKLYNEHFREMVITALICGLNHPIEWFEYYARGIAEPDKRLSEIDEFCDLAIKDLYSSEFCVSIKDVTIEMCNNWINKHYKQ